MKIWNTFIGRSLLLSGGAYRSTVPALFACLKDIHHGRLSGENCQDALSEPASQAALDTSGASH